MKTFKPFCKMLDVMDRRAEAWYISRPLFMPENYDEDKIGAMDLTLNSMRVYTLHMRSSVLFRDIMMALRPIAPWALSLRSMPLERDRLRLSAEFDQDAYTDHDADIDAALASIENGVPRDKARGAFPVTLSTEYVLTIDERTLFAFLKALLEKNETLFAIYEQLILTAINGYRRFKLSTIRSSYDFYAISDDEMSDLGKPIQSVGEMMYGVYDVKIALASQFLRQHYSKIKIKFWNEISEYFWLNYQQCDRTTIAFYIDKKSYHRLMSMRSHWSMDWSEDMWGKMIGDYVKDMEPDEFWEFLPNGGGKPDPYHSDVVTRVNGEDPGLPCPIMCEWPAMIDLKEKQVGSSVTIVKYRNLVQYGFIKDNPNNKYRKIYWENHSEAPKV